MRSSAAIRGTTDDGDFAPINANARRFYVHALAYQLAGGPEVERAARVGSFVKKGTHRVAI